MNDLQKLIRHIIMALHPDCDSYEEAVMKEWRFSDVEDSYIGLPISLARLMKALGNKNIGIKPYDVDPIGEDSFTAFTHHEEDGKELHLVDFVFHPTREDDFTDMPLHEQSPETHSKLLSLFE